MQSLYWLSGIVNSTDFLITETKSGGNLPLTLLPYQQQNLIVYMEHHVLKISVRLSALLNQGQNVKECYWTETDKK